MLHKIARHFANQWLAVLIIICGGTAYATGAVGGAQDGPLKGTNKVGSLDVIDGQVLAPDIGDNAVTSAKIHSPESWQLIAPAASSSDNCAGGATAVFCTEQAGSSLWYPWQNWGSPFSAAGFYRDQLGIVHLKGVVLSSDNTYSIQPVQTSTIFRLPVGYRPEHRLIFSVVGQSPLGIDDASGRVDIYPTGVVEFEWDCGLDTNNDWECAAYPAGYISLDGISFRRDG